MTDDPEDMLEIDPPTSNAQVPAGRWDVIIHDLKPATTQRDGTPYQQVTLEIIPGVATDAAPDDFLGRLIYVKQPWALGIICKALGYAEDPKTGKYHVSRSELIEYPLIVEIGYTPNKDTTKAPWLNLVAAYTAETLPQPAPELAEIPF